MNVVTTNRPDSVRAEKIVLYLLGPAFDLYFDRFTLGNARTEEAEDYGVVKKVILEKLSTQNTEPKIMREALIL